jgi:hypothetical protein
MHIHQASEERTLSDYPEHDKQAKVVEQTQAIGEFLDWLAGQGVHLMKWREDLTDTRPTGGRCRARPGVNVEIACRPTRQSDIGDALDYYSTHCLHWHDAERGADRDDDQPGICCWCGKGKHYEITGLQAWVGESRDTLRLLADWAEIDLSKIETEKRRMLASLRAANDLSAEG